MSEPAVPVLLIEDGPGDARPIEQLLRNTVGSCLDVVRSDRLADGLERLAAGGFAAVLLDLALPDSRGPEAFAAVHGQAPDTPIIVLTGLGDEAMALRLVEEGAQDYLIKGQADGDLLARSIRCGIGRKRAEAEVRRRNEQLEGRVRQRTAELEAANQELEAFTYSVSHDLRAPLRQVDGFVRLLVEQFRDRLDPTAQHYLRRIQEGAHQMGRLVDDLLNFARVGRQDLHPRLTVLNEVVEDILDDPSLEVAGREIDWRIDRHLPTVECDPGLIRVVLTNLLSNAVKYTRPRKRAVIEIGHALERGEAVLFVRDNGVGFDMRYADKLFGVFQRLHRAEEFEGTGVGLATVQRIVHKHRGRIWVEAELDRGATFYFTLGAAAAPEAR
jgi:signal transduction histidine kinase